MATVYPTTKADQLAENLLRVFGLQGHIVDAIDLHIAADEVCRVTIRREVTEAELDGLNGLLGGLDPAHDGSDFTSAVLQESPPSIARTHVVADCLSCGFPFPEDYTACPKCKAVRADAPIVRPVQ